mmetsp:Transcript_47547/g.85848  ORF Transcript_47547/g.85848 Transcript_47547/m.85848 type:complete len:1148 (+) Transcript_47547:102-3545(+)
MATDGMAPAMEELQENELFEAVSGLGNWHKVNGQEQYFCRKDECMSCLADISIALKHDSREPERGYQVHLKLGEWKVLPSHLVPLFAAYREDPDISGTVLKVLTELTSRVHVMPRDMLRHLEYLQDYKEAFVKKDVFIILMGMLVAFMEEEDEEESAQPSAKKEGFEDVLFLLRNLISVPDPRPGDAGYTPMRQTLQLSYINHFHDEGVLDFFLLFAETLESDRNEKQAWALLEILYHIVTQVDPEGLMETTRKEKNKGILKDLLERDQAHARIHRPKSSRHSRFGTVLERRDATGGITIVSSVWQQANPVTKGKKMWNKDFKNKAGNERKHNMFHDPYFVDLEEGSVKDHNQLNPHVRVALGVGTDLSEAVLEGLRKFFVEFVQTCFSSLVSFLRGTVLKEFRPSDGNIYLGRPRLMNFISWILEFHRHSYFAEAVKAKASKEPQPTIDIASIQGAIDVDMINFMTGMLRKYGKECAIHSSFLVLVLRTLLQQIKTITVVLDSQDSETRDCGEILIQNIVKDDVMNNLCWIMKNFKTSAHDLRVLSYSVEVFHHMTKLMKKIADRQGGKCEFHVERTHGARLTSRATTAEAETQTLADNRVVESLFHLLEKYKRHSVQLNSMLVKLLYNIIRAQPTNIVVFFELSYFVRIHRIVSDPLVRDKRQGKRYEEMVQLLRYIMRQFFKCAEVNKCVFIELLFRKVQENPKEALLESHTAEFAAILDNYEDDSYATVLERMKAGETFDTMKQRQKLVQDGNLPWTSEEDSTLQNRYALFSDHPLCAELLAAELPEDSRRTAKQVKKRLQELGLLAIRGRDPGRGAEFGANGPRLPPAEDTFADAGEPPAKKPKLDEAVFTPGRAPEASERDMPDFPSQAGIDDLEMDLERLLDRAWDSLPQHDTATVGAGMTDMSTATTSGPAQPRADASSSAAPGEVDLEMELEAMLDEEDGRLDPFGVPPASAASSASRERAADRSEAPASPSLRSPGSPSSQVLGEELPASLQCDLEALIEEGLQEAEAAHRDESMADAPTPSRAAAPSMQEDMMLDSLEGELEALLEEEAADRSNAATPGVQKSSQQASQADNAEGQDEEEFWEAAMQEVAAEHVALGSGPKATATPPIPSPCRSQAETCSQEDTLELELERIMDGG